MENLKLEPLNIDISSLSFKDYWGPDRDYVFEQFKNLPFAPFNKLDKISKVCDFTLQFSKPQNPQQSTANPSKPQEEEGEFVQVEGKTTSTKKTSTFTKRRPPHNKTAPISNSAYDTSKKQVQQRPMYNRNYPQRTKFKESNLVKSDWTFIQDISKTSADKVSMSGMPQNEVLVRTGTIREFDLATEKTDPKNEKPIVVKDGPWTPSFSTTSDLLFLELIEKDTETVKEPVLYTTDSLLVALMTLKQTNYPWEMIVTKNDNFIILDKPEKQGQSYIDLITANENTSGALPEEEKEVLKMSMEATNSNKNFINQVSSGEEWILGEENKATKNDRKLGYIYKRYTMDSKYQVVVRVEVDSYIKDPNSDKKKLCLVRALNEYDLGNDWRKKLTANRGAVLTSEIRNNSSKMFKWLIQANLLETDTIKLGFVSRVTQKDSVKHVVLGVDNFSLKELGSILNFKMKECWILIKYIIEYLVKEPNGKYAFVKLPFKGQVRIFRIPEDKKEEP